jgi:hypothetical protein
MLTELLLTELLLECEALAVPTWSIPLGSAEPAADEVARVLPLADELELGTSSSGDFSSELAHATPKTPTPITSAQLNVGAKMSSNDPRALRERLVRIEGSWFIGP